MASGPETEFLAHVERYVELARGAILGLLDREHAAVWLEIETKLAERPQSELPGGINPHHLTTARRQLTNEELIEQLEERTKGGRAIPVLALKNRRRRKTAFERAAARKRLLQTRYLGWASQTTRAINVIGEAGERVTHASLAAAGGYLLASHGRGNVTALFGDPIPGGALDAAAYLPLLSNNLPTVATILIEVKNVRHWMYPRAWELFQLLDKAARLQIAHPDQLLVPVFICRRSHYLTFMMAKELGFMIFQTEVQPILPLADISPTAVEEVRQELGYSLVRTDEAFPTLVHFFRSTLPGLALTTARRWALTAPKLAGSYRRLRETSLSLPARYAETAARHKAAQGIPGVRGRWMSVWDVAPASSSADN